jgi:hypothetical protein
LSMRSPHLFSLGGKLRVGFSTEICCFAMTSSC